MMIEFDRQLFIFLNNLGSESWDPFWLFITDEWMSIPLYFTLGLLVLWKTGFKRTVVSMSTLIVMILAAYGVSHLAKYGFARPRPCNLIDLGFHVRYPLAPDWEECHEFGFFSTHATAGIALILYLGTLLKPYFKWIIWPLVIWLFFFCYSRIYVGMHYPGDIIVGLIVGAIVGYLFIKIRKWIALKFQL